MVILVLQLPFPGEAELVDGGGECGPNPILSQSAPK